MSAHSGAPLNTEELFRALVESVEDYAIFMLDANGNVVSWSRGAERIKGYSEDEVLGRHFSIFYSREQVVAGHPQHELELAAREGRYAEEGWRLRRDGTRFWALVVMTAIRDESGEVVGFAKVTRDITARRRGDAELRQHRERLEERVAEQTRDLERKNAMLREETRRAARLAVQRRDLVRQALDAEDLQRQRFSEGLHDEPLQNLLSARQDLSDVGARDDPALRRAIELVDLTIAQLRETVVELHPIALTYGGFESTVNALAERAAARGGFDAQVHVDRDAGGVADELVISVLRELLTNVVKHANASRVEVEIKRADGSVALVVSDDGIGIPAQQLSEALRTGHIGLASTHARIEALDGSFEIAGEPHRGTTVRCSIPVG